MKFTQLPVMGEENWFNHTLKSIQEAGSEVSLDGVNWDYVLTNGASIDKNDENRLYLKRVTFSDGKRKTQIVEGVGKVHHPAMDAGQHFSITLPYMLGRGSAIVGDWFTSERVNFELNDDGKTVDVYPLDHISESTQWINFIIVS